MKSLKSILVVLLLNISSLNAIDLNKVFCGFTDVKVSSEYCADIHFAKLMGIVKGYDDATYNPSSPINRAEFMTIALKSKEFSSWVTNQDFEVKSCDENNKLFSDVSSSDWYCTYIKTAIKYGFIDGTKDNFNPSQDITLAETLKVLLLIHGKNSSVIDPKINIIYDGEENQVHTFNQDEKEETEYTDGDYNTVPREGWYFTYVNWAKEKNLSLFNKQDIDYEKATIKREEILRMYREIEDVLTCNVENIPIEGFNLKNKTPNCYQKAVYYSYVTYGRQILEDKLSLIHVSEDSINLAKNIMTSLINGAESVFTLELSHLFDNPDLFISTYENYMKTELNDETKLVIEVVSKILSHSKIFTQIIINPLSKFIIIGIFESIQWISNSSFEYALADENIKKFSIDVADIFLKEYYEDGGKIISEDKIEELINTYSIQVKNNYEDIEFNKDLTYQYIDSVIKIVNLKYKAEM